MSTVYNLNIETLVEIGKMKIYCVEATVNYPEQTEVPTPKYTGLNHEGAYEFVRRLLKSEPEATSFVVTITVEN